MVLISNNVDNKSSNDTGTESNYTFENLLAYFANSMEHSYNNLTSSKFSLFRKIRNVQKYDKKNLNQLNFEREIVVIMSQIDLAYFQKLFVPQLILMSHTILINRNFEKNEILDSKI